MKHPVLPWPLQGRRHPLPCCLHPPDERQVAGQDAGVHHHHIARQQLCGVDRGDPPVCQHLPGEGQASRGELELAARSWSPQAAATTAHAPPKLHPSKACGLALPGGRAHLHLAGVVRQCCQAAAVLVRRHHISDDGEEGDANNDQAVAVVRLRAPAEQETHMGGAGSNDTRLAR